MGETLRVIALGDIVGRPGRRAVAEHLPDLKREFSSDLVIANGENSAGGAGIDIKCAEEIKQGGVDVITLGDHTWQKKEIHPYLDDPAHRTIRPGNYPKGAPGLGYTILERKGIKVGVMNFMGRLFIQQFLDCPFQSVDALLNGPLSQAHIIICDFHAEATSEKLAFGHYLDGRVSLVFGTHTHVPTADEQILPGGTGYITDIGMCGPKGSVLGVKPEISIDRFLSGLKFSYELGENEASLSGIFVEIDIESKKTVSIKRLSAG